MGRAVNYVGTQPSSGPLKFLAGPSNQKLKSGSTLLNGHQGTSYSKPIQNWTPFTVRWGTQQRRDRPISCALFA
jgi:hypothetical protein